MRNLKYVFIANGGPKHLNLILFGLYSYLWDVRAETLNTP